MKSKIIVDSSANVYQLPDVDFACVPLKILTDEQEYVDTEEVDAPALAQMMRTYKGRTSTSCPNISDWLTAYEGADEVYVVTITGTLSGAYNAALLAGEEYEQSHEGARVFVLDSLSTGAESRLLVERLAALIKAGKPFDTVCEDFATMPGNPAPVPTSTSLPLTSGCAANSRLSAKWRSSMPSGLVMAVRLTFSL